MNTKAVIATLLLALAAASAADPNKAATLEARLKESIDGSESNARIMLELIELYQMDEQVFGLIRTASRFTRAQPDHPQRPEVIADLMDGYAVTARHRDVITTGRQFLAKYEKHQVANRVREHLATSYRITGAWLPAAETRADMWRAGNDIEDGIRALKYFAKLDNITSARAATALTLEMSAKSPANETLTAISLKGLEFIDRCEQWADGLQIVKNVQRRKAPASKRQERSLFYRAGQFESRLGQHGNAIQSLRKALGDEREYVHRALIDAMFAAKRAPEEIEREARAYLNAHPGYERRYDPLARVAQAYYLSAKRSQALKLALEIISVDVHTHDMPRSYVEWCGDDHAQAEQGLKAAIAKEPKDVWKLRATLVFNLYRDRMKNVAKSRDAAHQYIKHSPANHDTTEWIAAHLLNTTPDEATLKKDLAALAASAREHIQVEGYATRLWKAAPEDKSRLKTWNSAQRSFSNDPINRLWSQTHDKGGKGAQACKALLEKSPNATQREWLMARKAYLYRHHLGGGARRTAARHYQQLCKAYPKNFEYAERWLEAADYAENEKAEQALAAAEHLLTLKPQAAHHETWKRLIETRNPDIARNAIAWITQSTKVSRYSTYYTTHIGDVLHQMELKQEALDWWRSRMDVDPDNDDCISAADRVASRMEPKQAMEFLKQRYAKAGNGQGRYAGLIARLALRNGDLDTMDKILADSKKRALHQPFETWSIGDWMPRDWLKIASTEKDWTDEKRIRVYTMVRNMGYGDVSAEASMLLAKYCPKELKRLLEVQGSIANSRQHHDSWERIFAHAQAAIAREDHSLASAILNGLIHSVRSVGNKEMDQARTMLRRSYGILGSASSDIPADSPIAPLLHIVVHQRLGEIELAEKAYDKHRKLFDQHRNDLPVDLVIFGAETHLNRGTEEDLARAEDILSAWKIAHSESETTDVRDKARVQLLLAKKYQQARQFDAARLEYTTVVNNFGDQPEAMQARFGIGETFMAQKIFDKAEQALAELSESPDPTITIRADFLLGVLAIRQGENERARQIFLEVLGRLPEVELANETLYQLAEVYGLEQRYLTQLETLRTVGRLGHESKRWHTPGNALSVVVQDTDLGISRGETRIPVIVRTQPGGDIEASFLASGGAGKGIFLTELPTTLGEAIKEDGTLQVTGGDVITVDYPDDFKKEFQFDFLSSTKLRISSDGTLEVASSEIINTDEESFTEILKQESEAQKEQQEPETKSASRPKNQIKPGNFVYAQVLDGDRDITSEPDKVPVKLTASSGDVVLAELTESDRHGGHFSGSIKTGELPAGASASDSAIDHNALMAIDHSDETFWRSEPDGAAPKSLTIDMKDVRPVSSIAFSSPDAQNEAPVRMHLRGSHDGRFWYSLGHFPTLPAQPRPKLQDATMRLHIYEMPVAQLKESYSWKEVLDLLATKKAGKIIECESLDWTPPEKGDKGYLLVWAGQMAQQRDGGMRLEVSGEQAAIMVNGRLELAPIKSGGSCDIYAKRGLHELVAFATTRSGAKSGVVGLKRGRENSQSAEVKLSAFGPDDFKTGELKSVEGPIQGSMEQKDKVWTMSLPTHPLRYIECNILEYRGDAVAINRVEVKDGDTQHVPPADDVLELAENDILELAPGDTVTVSYLDELTAENRQPNRILTAKLTATYYNGKITPIGYDFSRAGDGSVGRSRKELLRIEPGDRIVAEVVDFDHDVSPDKDTIEVQVQVGSQPPVTMTATESEASSGIFLCEIDTTAGKEEGKLTLKRGDTVHLSYIDEQNTFPGHASKRETFVLLNEATEGRIQIVDSARSIDGKLGFIPVSPDREAEHISKVDYHLALTIEVIDPDQARDTSSKVMVDVATTQGTKIRVECRLSRQYALPSQTLEQTRNPALFEGRFVGQIPLMLGDIESADFIPSEGSGIQGGIGRLILLDENGEQREIGQTGLPVLNVNGKDQFTASYSDTSRPDGESSSLQSKAALHTAATLRITDEQYQEDAELLYVGKKLYLLLEDPDLDISSERDKAMVRIRTASGEEETIELEETLSHSGRFSGSFPLKSSATPTKDNTQGEIECFFGDIITVGYLDNVPQREDGEPIIEIEMPVAVGTNGELGAFSKVFKDEDLAVQTRFHIAESYFELFKSHLKLERKEEAMADLASGRRVLRELREDHHNPKYAPRVAYLLGQFAQEMQAWDDAIDAYRLIVTNHPEHELAADAQYKLGQCYEEAGQLDEALESYVTLAATYPKSPLIANVMLRINEHFYTKEEFAVAASVGDKFLERFPNHEWAPRMAFRIGQCHYKQEAFQNAGLAFDAFVKRFPEQELTAQALFWGGESYRMAKNVPEAFRRYNRCRWDFPESEAAKYSRGRLALPEMLAQFEREANLTDN